MDEIKVAKKTLVSATYSLPYCAQMIPVQKTACTLYNMNVIEDNCNHDA